MLIAGLICFLMGCKSNSPKEEISIIWAEEKPVSIRIPNSLLSKNELDDVEKHLIVRLASSENQGSMLGSFGKEGEAVIFRPMIPLTGGLVYQVMLNGKEIKQLKIPQPEMEDAPNVVAVYPQTDSVPENLLKLYIEFSRPMQEGNALDHLVLIKNETDTLRDVFLDLQPELWNQQQTILTVWLDPGRIKRDLQPNKKLGNPLRQGNSYKLIIRNTWQAANGLTPAKSFEKKFVTIVRDSLSPDPAQWKLHTPKAGTRDPLVIAFSESLDYFVAENHIQIQLAGKTVAAEIRIDDRTRIAQFIPEKTWQPGAYQVLISASLEDLAGNNLDHVFDRDLLQPVQIKVRHLTFTIQ